MCEWMEHAQDPRDYLVATRVPPVGPLQAEIMLENKNEILNDRNLQLLKKLLGIYKIYLGMDYKPWWRL